MSHNKGKKYQFCEVCKRRRYCVSSRSFREDGWDYINRTCSKGHILKVKVGPFVRILEYEIDRILPKLEGLFERDNIFYSRLKR